MYETELRFQVKTPDTHNRSFALRWIVLGMVWVLQLKYILGGREIERLITSPY